MPEPDLEIRRARREDAESIARVHVETWRTAYRDLLPPAVIESLSIEDRRQRWLTLMSQPAQDLLVAVRFGAVAGFCSLIRSRDADATDGTGEIAALYVASEHWRTGAGRQLLLASHESARQRGFRELTLWVLRANARARAFYSSAGYCADGAEKIVHRNGHALHELRYRRPLGA
jgi:ribosomal protein S18 acetylase RimI-like enzyme